MCAWWSAFVWGFALRASVGDVILSGCKAFANNVANPSKKIHHVLSSWVMLWIVRSLFGGCLINQKYCWSILILFASRQRNRSKRLPSDYSGLCYLYESTKFAIKCRNAWYPKPYKLKDSWAGQENALPESYAAFIYSCGNSGAGVFTTCEHMSCIHHVPLIS